MIPITSPVIAPVILGEAPREPKERAVPSRQGVRVAAETRHRAAQIAPQRVAR